MDAVTTLIFDVMGTVVDDEGSAREQATALLETSDLPAATITDLLKDWSERVSARMDAVRAGDSPWLGHQGLRRACLEETLAAAGVDLPAGLVDDLSTMIHRLRPWPDSPDALATLRRSFTVVALSNADPAELVDLSAAGGLAWHGALSSGAVRSFKPDPAVYRMALDQLAADPAHVMMVAAHPWDLRAAAEHGLATAYIARPGAVRPAPDDDFTVTAEDLHDLARILTTSA